LKLGTSAVLQVKACLSMPTVLQVGPYGFIFFSSDRSEPPHIHVKRDRQLAKYWLDPIALEKNRGFKEHELNQIAKLVEEHQTVLLDAWHDYFDT
jgi:hypothetical protein